MTPRPDSEDVGLSHPDKLLFPADGITKADLAAYYRKVAALMLPHLRDRPLMLERYTSGIAKAGFIQKDASSFPPWFERIRLAKQGGSVEYPICSDEPSLVYLVNQNTIALHGFLSTSDRPEWPDRLVFDLDPSDTDFATVREGAQLLKALLRNLELESFLMTTGSRGLHVVVPLDASSSFDDVRAFARDLASLIVKREPDHFTIKARKAERRDRVYIDVMRNAYAQTSVMPYSVRARPGAPVAMPIAWQALSDPALHPGAYTVTNISHRLGRRRDPWGSFAKTSGSINAASRALHSLARRDKRAASAA